MKRFFTFLLLVFFCCNVFAQTSSWVQKTDYAGTARNRARAFSIPSLGKGYIIGGYDGIWPLYQQDTYEYDTLTGNWTKKANFPGASTVQVAFSINGKGYAGTGVTYSSFDSTFWEYDPGADTWTKRAHFPGAPRAYAVGFSIGGKGYMGGGDNGSGYNGLYDFYVFDPVTDTWDTMAPCPAKGVGCGAVAFAIGGKGYVGTGSFVTTNGNQFIPQQEFWEYDPATNKWTQRKDFPGGPRGEGTGFATCDKGYIGTGYSTPNDNFKNDFWEYNPAKDKWTQVASFGTGSQAYAVGFAIGKSGYAGLGRDSVNVVGNWWQFTETVTPSFTTANSSSTNICAGQSVSFTDTSNYSPTNWLWNFEGGTPNSSTDQNPVIRYDNAGNYKVELSAWNGCDSASVTILNYVTVGSGGTLTVTANPPFVCSGQPSVLTIASGSGTYQWQPSAGLTDSTSASITANPDTTTTYTVTQAGGSGCALTGKVTVTVGNSTIGGTISAVRDTICQNTPGNLTLNGNSSSTLQWQSSTDNINFTDAPDTLTNYKTSPLQQTTWYRVVVGTGNCSALSDTQRLYVPPALTASFNFTQPSSNQLSFDSDSSSGSIRSYHWDFGDGETSTEKNPSHTYTKDTTYYVCLTLYDGSNCSYTFCRYSEVTDGVPTISAISNWVIYPNPFSEQLTVSNKQINIPVESVEIYDVLGRVVMNRNIADTKSTSLQLDVSSLTKGMYYVMIRTADADYVQKVVKQ